MTRTGSYLGVMTRAAKPRKRTRGTSTCSRRGRSGCASTPGSTRCRSKRHYLTEVIPPGPGAAEAKPRRRVPGSCGQVDERRSPAPAPRSANCSTATWRCWTSSRPRSTATRFVRQPHPAAARRAAGRPDRRRDPGLVLQAAPHAAGRTAAGGGSSSTAPRARTRVRRPVQAARLPAARRRVPAQDPRHPERRRQAGRPVGLGRPQPVRAGRTDRGAALRPAPADRRAGRADRRRSVARSRLGHARLAGDDDRRPARRAVRAALGPDRLRHRRARHPVQHRPARHADVGEGHQDPPAAPDHARPADARPARRVPRHCAGRADLGDAMPGDRTDLLPAARRSRRGSSRTRSASATQRMCARLGWDMHIHQLRHYSATELIAAGVDVRTVAGRLGHGGGGTTTLKVYSAFVAEADQRAAGALVRHLPPLPAHLAAVDGREVPPPTAPADETPNAPVPAHRRRPPRGDHRRHPAGRRHPADGLGPRCPLRGLLRHGPTGHRRASGGWTGHRPPRNPRHRGAPASADRA